MSPEPTGGVPTPAAGAASPEEPIRVRPARRSRALKSLPAEAVPGAAAPASGDGALALDVGAQSPSPGVRLVAIVVLATCIGLVGGGLAAWAIYQHFGPVVSISADPTKGGGAGQGQTVGQLAQSKSSSVVSIATQPVTSEGLLGSASAFANGVIVGADGLILTSAHAVQGASRLRVGLADGRGFDATVVGIDTPHGMVALRAAGASNLPALGFASGPPAPGDLAIAVSRPPLGALSLGVGTVSSTGQTVEMDRTTATAVVDAMTINASPEPNADGAPLLDAAGQVIGIVVTVTQATAPPGLTALSGQAGHSLADRASGGNRPTGATFGADAPYLDPATAAAAGLTPGALIRSVDPTGTAALAGLVPGDIVTAVNGTVIDRAHPFDAAALGLQPGEAVTAAVVSARAGRNVALQVGPPTCGVGTPAAC